MEDYQKYFDMALEKYKFHWEHNPMGLHGMCETLFLMGRDREIPEDIVKELKDICSEFVEELDVHCGYLMTAIKSHLNIPSSCYEYNTDIVGVMVDIYSDFDNRWGILNKFEATFYDSLGYKGYVH